MSKKFQVVGIGNAIVDIFAHIEDDFLTENGIDKGIMHLVERDRSAELYAKMGPATERSGGSAANTVAGLAGLGARTAYVGKVKDDQLGTIFAHDMRSLGATFETPMAMKDHPEETARSMILISPDGERSMNTYLGVSASLAVGDIDPAMMHETEWLYMEGYLYDKPASQHAFDKAAQLVKAAGGKTSITLSDPFCVERHREAFLSLIRNHIDLVFANEDELKAMYQTDDLSEALTIASGDAEMVACTVGARGAYIVQNGEEFHAPATDAHVEDLTGAGDLFAAGVLYGLANDRDLLTCGRMGCVAAGEVISHVGARPDSDLLALFRAEGLV